MFVKAENDEILEYPYSIKKFRADNPTISFPAELSNEMLATYGVYPVGYEPAPAYNPATQKLVKSSQPSLVNGSWVLTKSIVTMAADEAQSCERREAAQQRRRRDQRLEETDWCALNDVTMSAEMSAYRQALRDVPQQAGFPYTITWPTKP